eukprot:SAG25_NODE_303_length_10153_cov_13.304356_9_plen_51_part_00
MSIHPHGHGHGHGHESMQIYCEVKLVGNPAEASATRCSVVQTRLVGAAAS